MSDEARIYEGIASLLIGAAPEDAQMITYSFYVDAEDTLQEGAAFTYEFDYVDKSGVVCWLDKECSGIIDPLTELSLELRSLVGSAGESKWKGMKFYVDMTKQGFKAEFSY